MKIKLIVLALALALAGSLQAQTATHFTLTGNASSFSGASGTSVAALYGAYVQATPHFSLGYLQVQVPAISARFQMGVVNYTRPLNEILGKNLTSKFVFDISKINVTFQGGGGKMLQPIANRIAETGGIYITYPLSDNVSVQLVGISVLHGGVQTGFVTTSTTEAVSTGLTLHF